jgi:SAM-dependent methyltransferase
MSEAEIFDRRLRRLRRDRAAPGFADHAFIVDHMIDELLFRLEGVTRTFSRALVLGAFDGRISRALAGRGIAAVSADAGFAFARQSAGVQCDEDRLPFADGIFDLVLSAGVLDSVNDLPGALALIRRALKPDGLLLAGFVGAGSLPQLRSAALAADMAAGGAVPPRIHPQIDVRSAGDLLVRAGFALPVADSDRLMVGYADPLRLAADLRGMAAGNLLRAQTPPAIGRHRLAALYEAFLREAEPDGRVRETFETVYLTGWAPAPQQPRPARRGSATRSLADALRRPQG